MRILPQSASISYSPLPLLPAPAPIPMLPAPQLAGLLSAPQIIERRQPCRSRVFRTLAEWNRADEELVIMFEAAIERINAAWEVNHA